MRCAETPTSRRGAATATRQEPQSGPGGRTCTRTGRGLSSLPLRWATPGKEMDENAPGADPAAPQGRSRINVRKVIEGLFDFAQVQAPECSVPVPPVPPVTLGAAFEPIVTAPAAARLEPAIQLTESRRD